MKRKTSKPKPRLPMEAIESLGRGHYHSTKKGKKGYVRRQQKKEFLYGSVTQW
jgi:hypothetical protein